MTNGQHTAPWFAPPDDELLKDYERELDEGAEAEAIRWSARTESLVGSTDWAHGDRMTRPAIGREESDGKRRAMLADEGGWSLESMEHEERELPYHGATSRDVGRLRSVVDRDEPAWTSASDPSDLDTSDHYREDIGPAASADDYQCADDPAWQDSSIEDPTDVVDEQYFGEHPEQTYESSEADSCEESRQQAVADDERDLDWGRLGHEEPVDEDAEEEWYGKDGESYEQGESTSEEAWAEAYGEPADGEDAGDPAWHGAHVGRDNGSPGEEIVSPTGRQPAREEAGSSKEARVSERLGSTVRTTRGNHRVVRARVASLPSRCLSWLIDGSLVLVGSLGLAWMGSLASGQGLSISRVLTELSLTVPVVLLASLIGALYTALAVALMGQTLGGRLTGVRILDGHGMTPDLLRSFMRGFSASAGVLLLGVGLAWVLVDDRGQTLHDRLFGTFAVEG